MTVGQHYSSCQEAKASIAKAMAEAISTSTEKTQESISVERETNAQYLAMAKSEFTKTVETMVRT